ncbi:MAG: hypothetical protein V4547_07315 [Bacteroidota bacterium]
MKRKTFLLIGAIGQLFIGVFFLVFTEMAASQLMKETTDAALLLQKNLGIFSIAFGIITLLSRKSPDTIALKAIFIGTLFYLIASVCADAYGVFKGIFTSQGWGGIVFRGLFIAGYFYYLAKMKITPTTK